MSFFAPPLPDYWSDLGPLARANGYSVVPIQPGEKMPIGTGWQHRDTSQEVWRGIGAGVGILTRDTPALDIDVDDAGLVLQVCIVVGRLFPHDRRLLRVGREPRLLLLFRLDGAPFPKQVLRLPDRGGDEVDKLELLADGQQFVAFGRHPTGTDYRWGGGEACNSPATVPHSVLPLLSAKGAAALMAKLAEAFGGEVTVGRAKSLDGNAAAKPPHPWMPGMPGMPVDPATGLIRNPQFDALVELAAALGMVKNTKDDGVVEVECPWLDQHGGGRNDGAKLMPPSAVNGYNGHFLCHHETHGPKNLAAYKEALWERSEEKMT